MFKNQLKIAWRSIKKQPFLNALNTFGLAIGIAGTLLICLYIYDELSYDKMFADAERIHRINVDMKFGGPDRQVSQVSGPMAEAVLNDIPQVESAVRFRPWGTSSLNKTTETNLVLEDRTAFADSTLITVFGLNMIYGNPNKALTEPNTLILTKTAAEKHFPIINAIGQKLILNEGNTYTITGIIEDLPNNSFLADYSVFMSMASHVDNYINWGSHNYNTFIKLKQNTTASDIAEPLAGMMERYLMPYAQQFFPGITKEQFEASGNYVNYSTIPLTDMHLYSHREQDMGVNGDINNIYILGCIALFLILLASINYMNLSTAYSLKRAKEVGIRKTLGSNKNSLVKQFLTESGLITFGAMLIAIVLAIIALPFFNQLGDKSISVPLSNPFFWMVLILSAALLALLSGSYPAFFMSKFKPVKVLKGGGENSTGGSKLRKALVIFQFAVSVFLIVGTLVVSNQLQFMQNKDLGYSKDQVLLVNNMNRLNDQVDSFKEEVMQLAQVSSASLSAYVPTPSYRSDSSYFLEDKLEQESAINMQGWQVDFDYMETLDLTLLSGRTFDSNITTDSTAVIINESALKVTGLDQKAVLGKRIFNGIGEDDISEFTVIGVVKNFHFETMRHEVRPLSLQIGRSTGNLIVKLKSGNFTNTISQIQQLWDTRSPSLPFDYQFMDESFNEVYENERRLGDIFIIFTSLSIFIACLGLFGLAAFNAQKRIKEIGVRKVLGATIGQITYRLSFDFLKLVFIAITIALPVGWFAMNKWLEDFSYRVEIKWWVLVSAAVLAILISLLTVSYQSIKAAIVNPVKSLKTE
ncbi:ABC transporter permease [Flagellimonas eckloniae]|uniref:Cell division protein FtsX n=1 Tax=Flagellimonas eckloniae TaxID=346185 RepID=A0A0N8WG70_9FLAO|nr:ABC transporter permease [Allomuricauda eckloniae]KQC30675.1 cell division protein FtsX [Allomuricauda eckloniae]